MSPFAQFTTTLSGGIASQDITTATGGGLLNLSQLRGELERRLFASAAEVCAFVLTTFGIRYTPKGMVQTLHRLGYSYKKTTPVGGKSDRQKQRAFQQFYEARYKCLPQGEMVVFLDGCHPTFNNHPGYAWIQVGRQRPIKTHDGRKRLNLMGAYAPAKQETLVKEYPTLDGSAVQDFLTTVRRKYSDMRLHIVLDNVRYHRGKALAAHARRNDIELVFLPPYSPNLNLIERFWGLVHKKVLTNQYYETFEEFRAAILSFSRQNSRRFKRMLASYMPEKFHLLPVPPN